MAEANNRWYNPFDPVDPDALASAAVGVNPEEYSAQVATRPGPYPAPRQHSRTAQRRMGSFTQPSNPNQLVSGEFGALDTMDRTAPGFPGAAFYPGRTFDPSEAAILGVPAQEGAFRVRDLRAPTMEDYFNPISQQAGYISIYDAAERDRLAVRAARLRRIAEQKAGKREEEDQDKRPNLSGGPVWDWGEPDLPTGKSK